MNGGPHLLVHGKTVRSLRLHGLRVLRLDGARRVRRGSFRSSPALHALVGKEGVRSADVIFLTSRAAGTLRRFDDAEPLLDQRLYSQIQAPIVSRGARSMLETRRLPRGGMFSRGLLESRGLDGSRAFAKKIRRVKKPGTIVKDTKEKKDVFIIEERGSGRFRSISVAEAAGLRQTVDWFASDHCCFCAFSAAITFHSC